jgi:hypothetical protein
MKRRSPQVVLWRTPHTRVLGVRKVFQILDAQLVPLSSLITPPIFNCSDAVAERVFYDLKAGFINPVKVRATDCGFLVLDPEGCGQTVILQSMFLDEELCPVPRADIALVPVDFQKGGE